MVICKVKGCSKKAHYGQEQGKPLNCGVHRQEGHNNVSHPKCPCGKQMAFGFVGDDKPSACGSCMKEGMIDIKSKRCPCGTQPSFGYKDDMSPSCCKSCRKEGMIDLINKDKLCECGKRPTYGLEEDYLAICCKDCKTDDMIDVKHKLCECGKRPSYGLKGDKEPTCCQDCMTDDMENIVSKFCICGKIPNFNFEGQKNAVCCFDCREDGMIDIKHPKCLTVGCGTQISNKSYKGYCTRCFAYIFPDEPMSKNFKTKEREVVSFIKEKFEDLDWVFDKRIKAGSSLKRPDALVDLENQVLIIEIDENQHKLYGCCNENKRLMELSLDVNHKSMVFIRFNPDKYLDINGKTVSSCFSVTKETGKIKINNNKKWTERLNSLKEQIDYWLKNDTDKMVEVIQLYYDENY
jgi:hypothetical protein